MRPRLTALLAPALASVVAASLGTACASNKARRKAVPVEPAFLEVRNNYLSPVNLFALTDNGFSQRIASSVGTSRPQRFRLPPALINAGGTIRIIAVPIAENNRASTGRITVRPGDVVQFTIASDLNASSVFIR